MVGVKHTTNLPKVRQKSVTQDPIMDPGYYTTEIHVVITSRYYSPIFTTDQTVIINRKLLICYVLNIYSKS